MKTSILSGLDRLSTVHDALAGRKLGLMTNPTGISRELVSAIDILHSNYRLEALFACEHGVRGDIQAGERVEDDVDTETGVPVCSLYGANGPRMTRAMTELFDTLVIDLQDVGARFYTYLYSLSYALEACAAADKPVVVLDRINPIGGERIEGWILDERFHSFVGEYALPARTALTIGEYALWVKAHLGLSGLSLTVVPLAGWQRHMYLDDTDVAWVAPSPNCATLGAALCYPGTCIFEGTNLSEGRGTTLPFEWIGAPWVDAAKLARRMNALRLPGIGFRRCAFTPTFSKYQGELCHGVQMHILDRGCAEVFRAGLLLLETIRDMRGDQFRFLEGKPGGPWHIDRLLGTDRLRLGADTRTLTAENEPLLEEYRQQKKRIELY